MQGGGGYSSSVTDTGAATSGGGALNVGGGINSPAIGSKSSWVTLALGIAGGALAIYLLTRIARK